MVGWSYDGFEPVAGLGRQWIAHGHRIVKIGGRSADQGAGPGQVGW